MIVTLCSLVGSASWCTGAFIRFGDMVRIGAEPEVDEAGAYLEVVGISDDLKTVKTKRKRRRSV